MIFNVGYVWTLILCRSNCHSWRAWRGDTAFGILKKCELSSFDNWLAPRHRTSGSDRCYQIKHTIVNVTSLDWSRFKAYPFFEAVQAVCSVTFPRCCAGGWERPKSCQGTRPIWFYISSRSISAVPRCIAPGLCKPEGPLCGFFPEYLRDRGWVESTPKFWMKHFFK